MRMSLFATRCALIACSVFAVVAHAGDRPTNPQAEDHFEKGKKLYGAGDFDQAILEFKAGLMIEEAAIFHYDLGQCFWQTGDYKQAAWHYQRFLAMHAIEDQFSENAKDRVAAAQAKQQEAAPQPVQPAPGHPLVPAPQPAPQASTNWPAIGVLATGGAAFVVGGAFIYDAWSIDDGANHSASQQQANSLHDTASTRRVVGVSAGVGGLVLLGVGGLMLLHDHHARPATRASWNVGVSPNGAMVFGRF